MELTTSWHSYTKVHTLGHRSIREILLDEVHIEEKVDGSQFSFGVFDGELKCRSKGKPIVVDEPEKLFKRAVATAIELKPKLINGWTYRGECIDKPHHNVLTYGRVPNGNVIIWDINDGHESYLPYVAKFEEAARLGLETVPCLLKGKIETIESMKALLLNVSILGGAKIEGFVVKNYRRFQADGTAMIGKFVSEAFKEVHQKTFRKANATNKDIVGQIVDKYKTPARWDKAVIHMKEAGTLDESPKDIGGLVRAVQLDIEEECKEDIKDQLFAHAWPHIKRGVCGGLPQWYKEKLLGSVETVGTD